MTDEQKQYISLYLNLLKKTLKEEGLCFAFAIDKEDFEKSKLAIVEAEKLKQTGKVNGILISLEKLNEGLI